MAGYYSGAPSNRVQLSWIGDAYNEFAKDPWIWVAAVLIAGVPALAMDILGRIIAFGLPALATGGSSSPPSAVHGTTVVLVVVAVLFGLGLEIGAALYGIWITAGLYKMAATRVKGQPIRVDMLFSNASRMWALLGYSIVTGLAIGIGSYCCIVPGLVLAGIFLPGMALIADGMSFSEAFQRSIDGMKRDWGMAALLVFCSGLLMLISLIPCGLGLFVTVPMYYLLSAIAAREMCGLGGAMPRPAYWAPPAPTPPGVWPPPPTPPEDQPPYYGGLR